tara:strand:- start:1128 stop:2099 length:972 start_codon:yes stop_codon:yes gene_type:complete
MAHKYQNKINLHKQNNTKPSAQVSGLNMITLQHIEKMKAVVKGRRYGGGGFPLVSGLSPGHSVPWRNVPGIMDHSTHRSSPFYNYLSKNAITRTTATIMEKSTVGKTSIKIIAPVIDYQIRRGDTFYLYNCNNFSSIKLTANSDLLSTHTSLQIVSTMFTRDQYFPGGSFIMPDSSLLFERATNAPNFKRIELSSTQYQNLNTSPLVLLAAQPDTLHIPLSATLLYKYDSTEMTRTDLFIGHNAISPVIGFYWSRYNEAFYRERDDMLIQMTVGTYNNTSSPGIPIIYRNNRGIGLPLALYTSANFTGTSGLTVLLYYKSIAI